MGTGTSDGTPYKGRMQLIDNQVDARSGTVRVRAVFDNADGRLIPGQFARLLMGQPKAEPALLISERAVGTDQNKKFVMVVDKDSKAEYREVALGVSIDGMRVVTGGLHAGERIVVKGLQRVRPGALVAPEVVAMGPFLCNRGGAALAGLIIPVFQTKPVPSHGGSFSSCLPLRTPWRCASAGKPWRARAPCPSASLREQLGQSHQIVGSGAKLKTHADAIASTEASSAALHRLDPAEASSSACGCAG